VKLERNFYPFKLPVVIIPIPLFLNLVPEPMHLQFKTSGTNLGTIKWMSDAND
jgi:hypothetical protein